MNYPDGREAIIGDTILFENGTTGEIVAVISEKFDEFNVDEPGIMVRSTPFGLIFLPAARFSADDVSLEKRGGNFRSIGG